MRIPKRRSAPAVPQAALVDLQKTGARGRGARRRRAGTMRCGRSSAGGGRRARPCRGVPWPGTILSAKRGPGCLTFGKAILAAACAVRVAGWAYGPVCQNRGSGKERARPGLPPARCRRIPAHPGLDGAESHLTLRPPARPRQPLPPAAILTVTGTACRPGATLRWFWTRNARTLWTGCLNPVGARRRAELAKMLVVETGASGAARSGFLTRLVPRQISQLRTAHAPPGNRRMPAPAIPPC